ncbi:MAG: hypothetical protein QGF49_04425 [Candidatus Marinimicrobia bacterium]|jgi:hypothetical protein|nr:hypothetical protein [Candidatus Neomarinimicrobiota bacterium]MDP6143389.1 hypothetical protein [Candidatus Neomarinimicrobiota bacterium]MDP6261591.1 hypothetical protein [Candidatus Neomarinimicrobiota bacterium]MDP7127915.1 hypothetical protein [Candidatus Neomarinimicrobiota bacterium]MDP7464725.1 hypothetical protein [Candidatus Neomarinimicrobiota bacterium]|tara:strand:- start:23 stop:202 length:180 start_codon:yes stop_codon:yes gene_type:complete
MQKRFEDKVGIVTGDGERIGQIKRTLEKRQQSGKSKSSHLFVKCGDGVNGNSLQIDSSG